MGAANSRPADSSYLASPTTSTDATTVSPTLAETTARLASSPLPATGTQESLAENLATQQIAKEIEDKKVVIDKNLVSSLTRLSDLMKQFNRNDVPYMLDDVQSKGIKVPGNIMDKLRNSHSILLNSIDNAYTAEEKGKKIESNTAVSEYIQKHVDKDLDEQIKAYMENPFIKEDPMVQRGVVDVANSIKSIRGKYKFFEYKYLQMNIFLIAFINHVNETLIKFVNETGAFYEAREKYHLMLIRNLVKTFQEQLDIEAKDAYGRSDAANIGDSLKELTSSVVESITKQKEFTEKQKQQSLQDILKFLMERETEFANEMVGIVDKYKSDKKSASTSTRSSYIPTPRSVERRPSYRSVVEEDVLSRTRDESYRYRTPSPESPRYRPRSRDGRFRSYYATGGFVRDGSFFPQEFYGESGTAPTTAVPTTTTATPAPPATPTAVAPSAPTTATTVAPASPFLAPTDVPTSDFATVPPAQEGGFIRDESYMPQKFYEL